MTDIEVTREPLTYFRHGPHSYFRDIAQRELHQDVAASERLTRHGREVRQAVLERDARAALGVPGTFEVRVPANWTPGTGGDFAPPLWMIEDFATVPRPGRVLAKLVPHFDLPVGAQSINLPRVTAGAIAAVTGVDGPTAMADTIAETVVKSQVVTIAGTQDVPLPMLEQSPQGAPFDWAMFMAMTKAYDAQLEAQMLNGAGPTVNQIQGIIGIAGTVATYTAGSPTGSGLYPVVGQALAGLARARREPPECWLGNTARWAWLATSEDAQGLPFGLANHEGLDPIGSLAGFPYHVDESIPVLSGGAEPLVACKPSDLMLLESEPRTDVMLEPLSGTMGVRLQLRRYVAAVTARYPSGIAVVSGSGLVPVSGY